VLRRKRVEEAAFLSEQGRFVGLVTPESLRHFRRRRPAAANPVRGARNGLPTRMAVKLRRQAEALKRAVSQFDEVSYAVSHDVRTPLRAMRGYAQALQDDYGPRLDEPAKEYVRRIIRASHQLDRLTLGVLAYGDIVRKPAAIRRVDASKVISDVVAKMRGAWPQAEIVVEKITESVWADRALLGQCFTHLLENAVKFVPRDRAPKIRISGERLGEKIRLCVEDNGIGVRPEHRQRIFQLFERVGSDDFSEGLGVGLAVVRKAMEKMNGTVHVEPLEKEGSRFCLVLPA
jgi:light-regulated signal transduction histidine kinase (bacteriophytochrome)